MYFDHNATTPLLPAARQAWLMQRSSLLGILRVLTALARAEIALDAARETLAAFWIAVRSRSSGPPVPRSRVTWFCITSRRRSVDG